MSISEISSQLINILVTVEDEIALVKINRPKALNALNNDTLSDLNKIFDCIKEDDSVRGVIITGEGKGFVAGADIVQMQGYKSIEGRKYAAFAQMIFNKIESLEKPVISAVNGYALGGGCELSLSCDIRIASTKAVFGQPEVGLGVIPCFGGTQRLPRLIGSGIAKELIYTGRQIKSEEALSVGLVNKVVEPELLIEEAMNMMKAILKNASLAVGFAKVAINRGLEMDIDNALELEKDIAALSFATDDKDEGMKAFIEKRPAVFKNK
ncbi:enoyl-CoA hydratase-related protein [Clostridium sp.]|uniref:enoyl-CoA hydratase-related protein n=1 Tax=Clostridium sp. TaxID=1506 RepID=UPI00258AF37B|nr:enoyl-CoA hydratase-related protein [Clostridium sp.]MDF2505662.1 3-hydroxybutyryl-CoA dehydratase [Clostridium sp.]